jgi:hypothetical protein
MKSTLSILLSALIGAISAAVISNARPTAPVQAPTRTQYIQAERIDVVDRTGKLRISLTTNPQNGTASVSVSVFDPTHTSPRIILGTMADGTSNIQLEDENGQRRASLDYLQGAARLVLLTSSPSGGVVLGSSDTSLLTFRDHSDRQRAVLGLSQSDDPTVQFLNDTGGVIWAAPPTPNSKTQPKPAPTPPS